MIVAIVPAAGLSARMGRPKLVLDLGGTPVIVRVIRALLDGGADRVDVVSAPADQDGAGRIAELVEQSGARSLVLPSPTSDMRATIEHGIQAIASDSANLPDGILIAPGDAVGMSSRVVASVVDRFRADPAKVIVPKREGSGGHPLALPWTLAAMIPRLPPGTGVNSLVRNHLGRVIEIIVDEPDLDLDTPEDYLYLIARSEPRFPIP